MADLFSSILNESPTEVIRPKPLPEGTYLCTIGQYDLDKSPKKGTPFIRFKLNILQALEDVDEEELAAVGGASGKASSITFYLTADAVFRLDQFHEHAGLDLSDAASRADRNDAVIGAQVLVVFKHRSSDDGQIFFEAQRSARAE
jgi:hypothetical protein